MTFYDAFRDWRDEKIALFVRIPDVIETVVVKVLNLIFSRLRRSNNLRESSTSRSSARCDEVCHRRGKLQRVWSIGWVHWVATSRCRILAAPRRRDSRRCDLMFRMQLLAGLVHCSTCWSWTEHSNPEAWFLDLWNSSRGFRCRLPFIQFNSRGELGNRFESLGDADRWKHRRDNHHKPLESMWQCVFQVIDINAN